MRGILIETFIFSPIKNVIFRLMTIRKRILVPEVSIRNLGGVIVTLAKTEDGGAEVVAWVPTSKSWEPANFSAAEVLDARGASNEDLKRLGILKLSDKEIKENILEGLKLADQLVVVKLLLRHKEYLRNKVKLDKKELLEILQKYFNTGKK